MRALLSVYDKTGLVELARALRDLGWDLVSSGGTARTLAAAGIEVTDVADVTGVPAILDHRVVTLHPKIHGGLLADPTNAAHREDMARYGIVPFDLVVSNLYPFGERPGVDMIDIGGPAMIRAAAKNHAFVGVVTSPDQYGPVLDELRAAAANGDPGDAGTAGAGPGAQTPPALGADTRQALALEAFAHTAAYDAAVVDWLQDGATLPRHLVLALRRAEEPLRYGENPHQEAARYRDLTAPGPSFWDGLVQHGGLALSYLNYYDTQAAWVLAHDLGDRPAVAIIKHANPCGVGVDARDLTAAYRRALGGDELSAFGGIVALDRPVDDGTAQAMAAGPQADVVIAPGYSPGALDALRARRKNTRLLEAPPPRPPRRDYRQVDGGFLVQQPPRFDTTRSDWRVVTKAAPTAEQWADAELAWRICGHVKSNCVVLVKDLQAVGIGSGQQSRVGAGEIAAHKAGGRAAGGASATDGFYPFPDGVDAAAAAGVAVVVQPGGSVRDDEVVARADELGLAMVLTGERHFLH